VTPRRTFAAAVVVAAALAGCNDTTGHQAAPGPVVSIPQTSPGATDSTPATPTPATSPTAAASPSVHAQQAVARAAPFRWSARRVTAPELGKSWHQGCPVDPSSLRAIRLTFWGFDHASHTGTLVVNARVVPAVVGAFKGMYDARFPIRQIVPVAAYSGDDNKSMAADNTSAFNCRYAVSNGPKQWSMHAFGEAIDINTVENPYTLDGTVRPPSGQPYTHRSRVRPGMIVRGSEPVRAFSAVGWGWGGNWSSSPDYQHFSSNGK
jgi:hypothetical protein